MSDYESRVAELAKRCESIDAQVGALNDQRNTASLPASAGEKDALKLIARLDDQIEALLKERQTIAAASEQIESLITAERAEEEARSKREREAKAKNHADAVMALNVEIDTHLLQLREMFERRSALLAGLGRTEIVSSSLITRLSGKSGPTASACKVGLHKYLDIVSVSPISHRPLADVNSVLIGIGKNGGGA